MAEIQTSKPGSRLGPSVVDEVRTIRAEIDQEVEHDIHKLAERARRIGEEFRRRRGSSGMDASK